MDEMKIKSSLLTSLLNAILTKAIRKKINQKEITIDISDLVVKNEDGTMRMHVTGDISMPSEDFAKLVMSAIH